MATTLVNDYEVMYSSNAFPPRIWLSSAGKFFGQLIFHPDGSVLPPDALADGQINLQYHLEDFENCATILRNERTVYLLFNGAGSENGLMTTQVPPGS
jgi:hypothetical protein